MEKACGNAACSNTFSSSNNRKKFCSAACYPSVIATAAAKRLGRGQKSVIPAPAASLPAAPPIYTESPSSSPAARSLDTSWAPSPSGHSTRTATTPGRSLTNAATFIRCRSTACCNYFSRTSRSRQYCSLPCRPSSSTRQSAAAPAISPTRTVALAPSTTPLSPALAQVADETPDGHLALGASVDSWSPPP
jgi:hypothetical protein